MPSGPAQPCAVPRVAIQAVYPEGFPRNVSWASVFLSIVFPLLTIVVEKTTRVCAQHHLNPMPTFAHLLLVATVPCVLAWFEYTQSSRADLQHPALGFLLGAIFSVAGIYTAVFVPALPGAILFCWMGFPLLAFAPLASFLGCVRAVRIALKRGLSTGAFAAGSIVAVTTCITVSAHLPRVRELVGRITGLFAGL